MTRRKDPVESAYERRIRLASEAATWGVTGILVATAVFASTDPLPRTGLLLCAALLAIFGVLWFHVIPEPVFGRQRFTIGSAITQVVAAIGLVLTGGVESNYFVFFMFPTLATTFAMRMASTVFVGSIGLVALISVLVADGIAAGNANLSQLGVVHVAGFVAVVAMTALMSRTMQETRSALRLRSSELAAKNEELEVSRSTALSLARARDLGELLRAVYDSASLALAVQRVFFFEGLEADDRGWTVAGSGPAEAFAPDTQPRDSPRQRAVRSRRTVVVNDMAQEHMVGDRVRTTYGVAAGLFVPLLHRGGIIGLVAFNDPSARAWTARDVRLAEVIAESIAPSIASFLVLETVRQEREALADRTKVLEGMNRLVEALAVAPDEASTGQAAARAIAQAFRLTAATTLFVDPSIALLEPAGSAGSARTHPVVNGPLNCPAIRSGRVFRVASPSEPVICPYMPWTDDASGGYACVPLVAGGEPVGALFMEPTDGSALEEVFVRAAADRVALSLTNRRVLETAQRQATTDGLTGLHNRYFLQEQLRLLHSLAARHGQSYAAVAFDVDGLKQVNDTFGHEMGDLALRGFANTVKRTIRGSDVGVRTGGDEFLVLLPHGSLVDARILAERVRDAMLQQARSEPHTAVTVSAGVSAWRTGRTAEQVLEAADAMLYAAKRAGKDRIAVEPETEETPSPQSG